MDSYKGCCPCLETAEVRHHILIWNTYCYATSSLQYWFESKNVPSSVFVLWFFFLLLHSVFSDILRIDATNADALYVRGLCLYYEDCIEKAVQFFVQALKMAPDHDKACLACRVSIKRNAGEMYGFYDRPGWGMAFQILLIQNSSVQWWRMLLVTAS